MFGIPQDPGVTRQFCFHRVFSVSLSLSLKGFCIWMRSDFNLNGMWQVGKLQETFPCSAKFPEENYRTIQGMQGWVPRCCTAWYNVQNTAAVSSLRIQDWVVTCFEISIFTKMQRVWEIEMTNKLRAEVHTAVVVCLVTACKWSPTFGGSCHLFLQRLN
jgi:hypothetical protein